MSLGGAKDEHFHCFHSSCQLGLRESTHGKALFLLSLSIFSLKLHRQVDREASVKKTRESERLRLLLNLDMASTMWALCSVFSD